MPIVWFVCHPDGTWQQVDFTEDQELNFWDDYCPFCGGELWDLSYEDGCASKCSNCGRIISCQ